MSSAIVADRLASNKYMIIHVCTYYQNVFNYSRLYTVAILGGHSCYSSICERQVRTTILLGPEGIEEPFLFCIFSFFAISHNNIPVVIAKCNFLKPAVLITSKFFTFFTLL